MAAAYGLAEAGLAFYRFPLIPDPKACKVAYRRRMDELPLGEDEPAILVAESRLAFALNAAIFQELGDAYPEGAAAA